MLARYRSVLSVPGCARVLATALIETGSRADEVIFGEHQLSLKAPFRRLSLREGARTAASRRTGRDVSERDLRDRDQAAALASLAGA